jgi:putative aldouronate transport system substrate-binding protein
MADPTLEGETYFLPTWYTVGEKVPPGWAFVMRNDILTQLDLDTPIYFDNTEDFIDLLRDVKALNPVDINGSPAWPLGGIRKWNVLQQTITRLFDFGGGSGIDIDRTTGKLNHFVMTDFAWDQILFVRQLLEEQLIDPETFTHTFEVGREKVAQGRYIVEPFFAGGGISYHVPTIDADPSMSYPVIGNFYTHLGPDGPLLVNNLGMQTHFLNAFGADAPLDDLMPFIEFLASSEGNATNYYGVEGVHWDWDNGNAVLRDQYAEDFLSTDIPSPYLPVGTGRFNFWNEIHGKMDPSRMIFGGTEKPRYPLDPTLDDEIAARTALGYDNGRGIRTENGVAIAAFMESYPNKDAVQELLSVPYFTDNMLIPAYLADNEADARALLDRYRQSVERAGLDGYLEYLQDIYDADPDRYVVYESMGG